MLLAGITAQPPGERVTPQARNLLMNLRDHADGLQFSVRDRDAKFAAAFDAVVTAANVRIINTRAGNPGGRERGMAIASARRERLDQMLIIGERHLRLVLKEYTDHYDNHRPHRALRHDPPAGRAQPPVDVTGIRVPRRDQLGGLSREYAHAA